MDNISAIATAGVIVVATWLWLRHRSSTSRQAEELLRRVCLGNDGQVERLISGNTRLVHRSAVVSSNSRLAPANRI